MLYISHISQNSKSEKTKTFTTKERPNRIRLKTRLL